MSQQIKPCVIMSVWQEELMLPGCLAALESSGIPREHVYIFDGSWQDFTTAGPSSDSTHDIAARWGATFVLATRVWESQQQKRTEMFRFALAEGHSHAFVHDADERLIGSFVNEQPGEADPYWHLPRGHGMLMVKDTGPNDLPGIRGVWPHGDYCDYFKPELRWFHLSPALECHSPGNYYDEKGRIFQYTREDTAALPILEGVRYTHHAWQREQERIDMKRLHYMDEVPRRYRRQVTEWAKQQSDDDLQRYSQHDNRQLHDPELDAAERWRVVIRQEVVDLELAERRVAV